MADYQRQHRMAPRERRNEQVTEFDPSSLIPSLGPKSLTMMMLWTLGLWALFFGNGFAVDPDTEQRYGALMSQATFSDEARDVHSQLLKAQARRDQEKGWFWQAATPRYNDLQKKVAMIQTDLDEINKERTEYALKAKRLVGIWSSYGVDEAKQKFWDSYQAGKDFAKRMTFWDVMFAVGRSRDESGMSTILRWVGQICMNFTLGMVGSLIFFTTSLVNLIYTYSPDPLSGTLFFVMGFLGASGMVVVFLSLMYGTVVGGVYVVVKQAQAARLADQSGTGTRPSLRQQQQRQQQQQQQQFRQHYEHMD